MGASSAVTVVKTSFENPAEFGFARAMALKPELLCLDEPFSALDVLSAESLRGELMELWLNKVIPTQAILMVTHNILGLRALCPTRLNALAGLSSF